MLELRNVKTLVVQSLDIQKVREKIIHCSTCHSAQGSSVDGDITIFNKRNMLSYFNRKIENYKLLDKKAKREIPKDGNVNTIMNKCKESV